MTTQSEAHTYHTVTLRTLWWTLAAGAVIWSLHLIIGYMIVSLSCERGLRQGTWGTFAVSRWLAVGLTVVAAAVVAYAGVVAYRNWQEVKRAPVAADDVAAGRFRFMAWLALFLNAIFLLSIVVSLAPTLLLPLCD
ncbi:MAG: hypothetical protein DYG89_27740 [Caldilinea sp. CFX5]|nr:hypothetical protein [Caldilinea sp. CFX5]